MNSAPNHEIVIIRRGGHAHEEGHHGGVWKIAFADFMTAMMAFFLVLWIVNSSSKETRASIARYFNPVKLSDTTPARKGLQTAKELDFDAAAGESGKTEPESAGCVGAGKTDKTGKPATSKKAAHAEGGHDAPKNNRSPECAQPAGIVAPRFPEESLLAEPQAILAEILAAERLDGDKHNEADADRTSTIAKAETVPLGNRVQAGFAAEPAFSDPFEPVSPILAIRRTSDGKVVLKAGPLQAALPVEEKTEPVGPRLSETPAVIETLDPARPAPVAAPTTQLKAAPITLPAVKDEAKRLAADLAEALKDEAPRRSGPSIEIKAVPEGTLISLTDGVDFGMFAIGSAEPQPRVIALMARIAVVLKRHPGAVVVRGHTDGRQYPNARYDNWHLSADRAQMSFQMLLRGGLDPKRLDRIEGHADRMPKNTGDPGAAENRRIEILLKAAS